MQIPHMFAEVIRELFPLDIPLRIKKNGKPNLMMVQRTEISMHYPTTNFAGKRQEVLENE